MALPASMSSRLTLPIVCAPMFLISTAELVVASCKAGLIGGFPRQNVRTRDEFHHWLENVRAQLDGWTAETGREPGPLAINVPTSWPAAELAVELDLCARYGVEIIITSVGKPTAITELAHERGLAVWHDVTTIEFAEKAIEVGVDGLNCIGAGGGGHSGTVSHLALIPRIRSMFDGVVSMAGAVSTGAAVRVGELLGADLAFMGTRFAATVESAADPLQKLWMEEGTARDLRYTNTVNGVPANWMLASLAHHGIDVDSLPAPTGRGHDHLPEGVTPWRDLWSAGQGIELIADTPHVQDLIGRLATEYLEACRVPDRSVVVKESVAHGRY